MRKIFSQRLWAVFAVFIVFLSSCASSKPFVGEYQELIPVSELPEEVRLAESEEPFLVFDDRDGWTGGNLLYAIKEANFSGKVYFREIWQDSFLIAKDEELVNYGMSKGAVHYYKELVFKEVGKTIIFNCSLSDKIAFAVQICKERGIKGCILGWSFSDKVSFLAPYTPEELQQFSLGVATIDIASTSNKIQNSGVMILHVFENSPAYLAVPNLADGDIIIKIGDTQIKNKNDFLAAQKAIQRGETVPVTFMRGGFPLTTELKIPETAD